MRNVVRIQHILRANERGPGVRRILPSLIRTTHASECVRFPRMGGLRAFRSDALARSAPGVAVYQANVWVG